MKGFTGMNEAWEPEFAFDLEGEYALDEDRRIARRKARLEHQQEAIAFAEKQPAFTRFSRSPAYLARLREEMELLRPFWGAGVAKAEAVKAYLAASSVD